MADAAAPSNMMAYLFAKDVLHQSLRLGLAGAWEHDHPEMLDALRLLYRSETARTICDPQHPRRATSHELVTTCIVCGTSSLENAALQGHFLDTLLV